MMRYKVGRRETFVERAHGVMYSGRKTLSTRMTFATSCLVAMTFSIGAVLAGADLTIGTPLSPTFLPESKTAKIPTLVAMSGLAVLAYYNADRTGREWWIDETGVTRKPKEAKK
jgi:hypothetical protein